LDEVFLLDGEEIQLPYRGNDIVVRLQTDTGLSLWVNGCLRKQRPANGQVYLWTNIELEWEEHHYLEVYFHCNTGLLKITANGEVLENVRVCSSETHQHLL
jgi:hypothetical protein